MVYEVILRRSEAKHPRDCLEWHVMHSCINDARACKFMHHMSLVVGLLEAIPSVHQIFKSLKLESILFGKYFFLMLKLLPSRGYVVLFYFLSNSMSDSKTISSLSCRVSSHWSSNRVRSYLSSVEQSFFSFLVLAWAAAIATFACIRPWLTPTSLQQDTGYTP